MDYSSQSSKTELDILKQEQEVIFDYIHAFCLGGLDGNYRESSLSYNILGSKTHIKNIITQSKIRNFIDKHYHPSRMVLVAAGGSSNSAGDQDFSSKLTSLKIVESENDKTGTEKLSYALKKADEACGIALEDDRYKSDKGNNRVSRTHPP